MKTTCIYLDCQQKIEYEKEMAGRIVPCPACNRPTALPKLRLKISLAGIKKILLTLLDIYFDRKAISPDKNSPYYFIISLIYSLYCITVGIGLVCFIIVAGIGPILVITGGWPMQYGGSGIVSIIFFWGGQIIGLFLWWLLCHLTYKIARVIFDIAEYCRLTSSK